MTRPAPELAMFLLMMAADASDDSSEDSREVVQADEILAAIERGVPVECDGMIVEDSWVGRLP